MTTGSGQDAATLTLWVGCSRCPFADRYDLDYRDGVATWTCPRCKQPNREEGIHP